MKKRILLGIIVLSLLVLLCACSGGGKEFKYDNDITWNSSDEDILKKYGTPKSDVVNDEGVRHIVYENISVCGYDGFRLVFSFENSTGKLKKISLLNEEFRGTVYSRPAYNDIVNALTGKYGNPSGNRQEHTDISNTDKEYTSWTSIVKDTNIDVCHSDSKRLQIIGVFVYYENTALKSTEGL